MAPHFYNTSEEIEHAMRQLDEISRGARPGA
jgi:selenocysteine lyase/cysteine desulfurase